MATLTALLRNQGAFGLARFSLAAIIAHEGSALGRRPWLASILGKRLTSFKRALTRIVDPKLHATFTEFRDLWIALANRKQFLTPAQFDTEIEALGRIYSEWVSEGRRALH
jgi:hypothetical protein